MTKDVNDTTDTVSNQNNTNQHFTSSNRQVMEMLRDETMRQLEFAWEAQRKLVALCMPKENEKSESLVVVVESEISTEAKRAASDGK
jgi:hypothetical protein